MLKSIEGITKNVSLNYRSSSTLNFYGETTQYYLICRTIQKCHCVLFANNQKISQHFITVYVIKRYAKHV